MSDRQYPLRKRPVRSDGSIRRATFGWHDECMAGRITIDVSVELAFADEEPNMSQLVARSLREHADILSTERNTVSDDR